MRAPVLQDVHRGVHGKSGDTEHMSHLQEIYYRACGMQSIRRMNGIRLCSHVFMVYESVYVIHPVIWELLRTPPTFLGTPLIM